MRDLSFDDMQLFARVAELGTLSAVARERDVPVSQVSRALARIEQSCGSPLMLRSTHGLSLTAEGRTLLDYCQRLLDTLDELETKFAGHADSLTGTVRVATSPAMAHYLIVPSLAGLAERHPGLGVELLSEDRLVDMAREGADIAIRSGSTHTDLVYARALGHHGWRLYAAPAYLAAQGTPQRVEDLARHRLIVNTAAPHLNRWPFRVDGQAVTWQAQGHWCANSTGIVISMVLGGLGIGRCNTLAVAPMVERGDLVPVLDAVVEADRVPIHAMTLPGRQRLPRVRACLDWWSEWFGRFDG